MTDGAAKIHPCVSTKKLFRTKLACAFFLSQWFVVSSCQSGSQSSAVASALGSRTPAATIQKRDREEIQMLTERILKKDRTAILLARKAGPAASPELEQLLKNHDPEVREIALYCLDETGGPSALQSMAIAVLDENPQVRAAALRGLNHHAGRSMYANLISAYDKSQDPYSRQQIILLLARIAGPNDVHDLKSRCATEKDPDVQEGCVVSLARLNDKAAQKEFIQRLEASTQQQRARYLEYAQGIHAAWLMKPLLSILDDKTPMVRVGVDARPDLIQYLRACDLSVNLIASISGRTFSFPVSRSVNYLDAQIAEVKAYVQQLP